mgnify:FL=1
MEKKENNKLFINIHKDLSISVRTSNILKNQGIIFIKDLIQCNEKKILSFPGAGKGTIKEIQDILRDLPVTSFTQEIKYNKPEDYEKKVGINILNDWPLSERTFNVLKNEQIIYLGDLLSFNLNSLLKFKNFGRKSLNEIKEFLDKENVKDFSVDAAEWAKIREDLVLKDKNKQILEIDIENNLRGVRKTLFNNFNEFKKNHFLQKKIIIKKDIANDELQRLILEDIDYFQSLLSDKMKLIFKGRYAYMQNFETLENLGEKLKVTRERIRQNERDINKALIKIGKIDKYSLVEFFNKYNSISFHKLFPLLDKNFTNTSHSNSGGDITRDRLVVFMENYCGVKENYFTTPERELWNFNSEKLKQIFEFTSSGVSNDNFIEVIKDNYGYDDFTSKSALEFMTKKELIKIVDNKVYPIKINKNEEVSHILLDYSNGLHWKKICKIGNQSYTNNKWDLDRIVSDSSFQMDNNSNIYLSDRGTHRLIKFCKFLDKKDQLISKTINLLKELNSDQSDLEKIFKKMIETDEFVQLNFYDYRAIIKIFGSEKGLYHSGRSGTNTISFNKDIKPISLKEKIKEIINNSSGEIFYKDITKRLQKSNEDPPIGHWLNEIVEDASIFRISPGTYLNYKSAIALCDKKEIEIFLEKLLNDYEFITTGFMREQINKNLGYGLSNFYYDSLARILARDNDWFYGSNYLSIKEKKQISVDTYVKDNFNPSLSNSENFKKISEKIGISKLYFNNLIYQSNIDFNIDWVHQND